ncbi:MAG: phytanoyl-CoA dioxygenase family protein [Croceibacterium sp.]
MDQSLDHFDEHGWMRMPEALPDADAAAMRDALWSALAERGIHRDHPSTWTVERPSHLQRLRNHPAFRWCGSERLQEAIAAILGGAFNAPKEWGAPFIAFPSSDRWGIPAKGWHIDANYRSQLSPARGVKTLALFGDVGARGGGTQVLSGSHRLVYNWFKKNPPPVGARSAELRVLLKSHPYIRGLLTPSDPNERISRFMSVSEDDQGNPLQVVELTGSVGDVILMHPLVMHTAASNNDTQPRLMVSGGITTDMWGWDRD